jgi:hypothetical protein
MWKLINIRSEGKKIPMADKNSYESRLAETIHKAEREVGQALRSGNVDRVNRAHRELAKAEAELQECLDGRAYSAVKR